MQSPKFFFPGLIFSLSLSSFFLTAPPNIYTIDTPEFVAAAVNLGIPHAPGYSLYVVSGHLITRLPWPWGEAYSLNLLSGLCLALSLLISYGMLLRFNFRPALAASLCLLLGWSYYLWTVSLIAEVYPFQLLSIVLCAAYLLKLSQAGRVGGQQMLFLGLLVGLMMGVHPVNALFIPAISLATWRLNSTWPWRIGAALLSVGVFGLSLAYYPLRYEAKPALNTAGVWNAQGEFEAVNLQQAEGLWWLLSGQQFDHLMFQEGFLPTGPRLLEMGQWLGGNLLWVFAIVAIWGLWVMFWQRRGLLLMWGLAFLPYSYFFMLYGAEDRETMLVPSYWLCLFPLAFGLWDIIHDVPPRYSHFALITLPLLFFVSNYPLVNVRGDDELYQQTLVIAQNLPPEAVVFAYWDEAMPLAYLQIVEAQRPDLEVYNLFLLEFDSDRISKLIYLQASEGRPVFFLADSHAAYVSSEQYQLSPWPGPASEHIQVSLR